MVDLLNRVWLSTWTRLRREDGQTFVEYALIGVLVAVALVAVLGTLSSGIHDELTKIVNALK
jgi:Flp pilus assembly pilin Flp